MSEVVVQALHVYPVKACQGVAVEQAEITRRGISGDRLFSLWQDDKLVDQKETPALASLAVALDESAGRLAFSHPRAGRFAHQISDAGPTRSASWVLDHFEVCDQGDAVAQWLSDALQKEVRLVAAGEPWKINFPIPQFDLLHGQDKERFFAASPVSLASTSSLSDLNARLESPAPMDRFRMNLIVDGLDPWAEDDVVALSGESVRILRVTHCERCVITTTDQKTGERTKSDLLGGLRKHRYREEDRFGTGLLFGAYMAVEREGVLKVGERLKVEYRSSQRDPAIAT